MTTLDDIRAQLRAVRYGNPARTYALPMVDAIEKKAQEDPEYAAKLNTWLTAGGTVLLRDDLARLFVHDTPVLSLAIEAGHRYPWDDCWMALDTAMGRCRQGLSPEHEYDSDAPERIAASWRIPETQVKILKDETYVAAVPLLFHWMMIRGDIHGVFDSYFDRWCYETREMAMDALAAFPVSPPEGYEPSGWHRHPLTHRRRPGGDPAREYIDP